MARGTAAYYVTSLDRAGLALGAGGLLSGLVTMLLVAIGGRHDVLSLGLAWAIGAVLAMLGIVAVAGPVWLILHCANRRGPGTAASTGGALALLLLTAAQIGTSGGAVAGYRWGSALATAALFAVVAAGIGWAMQRIAYRRLL